MRSSQHGQSNRRRHGFLHRRAKHTNRQASKQCRHNACQNDNGAHQEDSWILIFCKTSDAGGRTHQGCPAAEGHGSLHRRANHINEEPSKQGRYNGCHNGDNSKCEIYKLLRQVEELIPSLYGTSLIRIQVLKVSPMRPPLGESSSRRKPSTFMAALGSLSGLLPLN